MFGNLSYLAYILIFTVSLMAFLWWRQSARLWSERRLIVAATAIVTTFGFLVWPYGLAWRCWEYSPSKILGITILGTVFEDMVWWLCISFLFSCTVALLARFEDEGKPLIATLLTDK